MAYYLIKHEYIFIVWCLIKHRDNSLWRNAYLSIESEFITWFLIKHKSLWHVI